MDGIFSPNSLPVLDFSSFSTTLAYQEAGPLSGEAPAGSTAQPGTTGAPGTTGGGGAQPTGQQGGPDMMLILMLGMGVFLVMMIFTGGRRQKKEKRERDDMLNALKRNDKVQTIGGIIGVVAEVRTDEVVLKVDDSGQNRVRFARSAIQQVISSRGGSAEAAPVEEEALATNS
ncbi:MAG: preprotein translocase subunit YajC [Phycisphaera sp.]|nr:MAG: preprotein translocase subunit YajC [Phycisphaera sp.]